MPRYHTLTDTRDVMDPRDFHSGSIHLRARGCPDPDTAYVRRPRQTRATGSKGAATPPPAGAAPFNPRSFARKLEKLRARMVEAQAAVAAARAAGDEPARAAAAEIARACRAEYLSVSGEMPERRAVEVDQGSAVNPMIAV